MTTVVVTPPRAHRSIGARSWAFVKRHALTVYALLRRFHPPREALQIPGQQRTVARIATDLVQPRSHTDGDGWC